MDRLLISAAHKSSGKTTVSIGLCHALSQAGHVVQPFKKGPDYIDPMWLGQATGRPCINLDFYTMQRAEIMQRFTQYSDGATISLIEGNKGLYDGLDLDGSNSNAALAKLLAAPVVLVIDVRGMTRGIAPLLLGYQAFDAEINIAGVIFNQVGGSRHESKLHAVVEHYTDMKVIGAVARDKNMEIKERHLGLIPSNEAHAAMEQIARIGDSVARQIDLDLLKQLAGGAPAPAVTEIPVIQTGKTPDLRIGVIRDEAFGFYYQDDLQSLRDAGAKLIFIDALRDTALPQIDALFVGGGFPESFLSELNANHSLRNAIRDAIENNLPAYAECGGLMYLARTIRWHDQEYAMCGVIPTDVVMHEKPQGRGYTCLQETAGHPWSALDSNQTVMAHEFHYSALINTDPDLTYAYAVKRGHGIDGQHDGIVYKNLLAGYTHLRDTGQNHWTRRFVDYIYKCQST